MSRTQVLDQRQSWPGNSRAARLARWLQQVPDGAYGLKLILQDADGHPMQVGTWDSCAPHDALQIEEAINSFLIEIECSTAGRVVLVDAQGEELSAKPVKARYEAPAERTAAIEGNTTSALRLLQEFCQQTMAVNQQLCDSLSVAAVENLTRARGERRELIEENERLRAELEDTKNQNSALLIEGAAGADDSSVDMLREVVTGFQQVQQNGLGGLGAMLSDPKVLMRLRQLLRTEVQAAVREQKTPAGDANGGDKTAE